METISAIPEAQGRSARVPVSDELQSHLLRMLALHFHPENGSPYWLKREREMGIDVRRSVKGVGDLYKLGLMNDESLRGIQVEEFVPRIFLSQKHRLILGDSAGSTGTPKVTAYAEEDFRCAFIDPFVKAAEAMRFPRGENWLFIGPSGPHNTA